MKSEIIQFLRENIIGKTLLTSVAYKLENGCLEGVYNDKMTFSNLVITENGFKFNMTTVTQELIYNLDDKGVSGKATQLCPFWPRRIIPFG